MNSEIHDTLMKEAEGQICHKTEETEAPDVREYRERWLNNLNPEDLAAFYVKKPAESAGEFGHLL
ncbi:uncharacterized protein BP5553_03481 [Venustampulla echinocandica]|uniref:Uncharacterized protein n=1 Tax=Venustampulla echinocandica TaxID=2656787 RepID=A0A370TUD6_9HELO|nr:uncharacterized protein BP5553_03481 [Venustampulla echinocandica]RDL39141.1 hypothetical protein BP5553_03481 [Venustampulla echinocandica]